MIDVLVLDIQIYGIIKKYIKIIIYKNNNDYKVE